MPNYLNAARHLYNTQRWRKLRAIVLRANPLCVRCSEHGRIRPATVCNHLIPHEGNAEAFWSGPFTALCADCHNGPARKAELGQRVLVDYDTDIGSLGSDGFPLDPRHPSRRTQGAMPGGGRKNPNRSRT